MPDTPHWTDTLVRLSACSDAVAWARAYPDLPTAWAACDRGDWMLWLAGKLAGPPGDASRIPLVRAACDCAELALQVWEARDPDSRRPHEALAVARRWCDGAATLEEVQAAAYAAATAYVADAAATAAATAYVADAAARCRRRPTLARCADLVRRYYPEPPELPNA